MDLNFDFENDVRYYMCTQPCFLYRIFLGHLALRLCRRPPNEIGDPWVLIQNITYIKPLRVGVQPMGAGLTLGSLISSLWSRPTAPSMTQTPRNTALCDVLDEAGREAEATSPTDASMGEDPSSKLASDLYGV